MISLVGTFLVAEFAASNSADLLNMYLLINLEIVEDLAV